MLRAYLAFWLLIWVGTVVWAEGSAAQPTKVVHLRLLDRLDRPEDGYCLDIPGVGQNLRLGVPVFAHNCKPFLTNDSAVEFTAVGEIRFVAVKLCITAAGVNSTILPGASLILRPCGHEAPFFESGPLQKFEHHVDGTLELGATGLCLAVGDRSSTTYSLRDRWRVLSVEDCKMTPKSLSRWEFVRPLPPG